MSRITLHIWSALPYLTVWPVFLASFLLQKQYGSLRQPHTFSVTAQQYVKIRFSKHYRQEMCRVGTESWFTVCQHCFISFVRHPLFARFRDPTRCFVPANVGNPKCGGAIWSPLISQMMCFVSFGGSKEVYHCSGAYTNKHCLQSSWLKVDYVVLGKLF